MSMVNLISVDTKNKRLIVEIFFQEAILTYFAAKELMSNLYYINQVAILMHLSIEYLLKGCDCWVNLNYAAIHAFEKICSRVNWLKQLYEDNESHFEEIDALFYHRYIMDYKDSNKSKKMSSSNLTKIQNKYDKIKLTVTGIPVLPGELGTDTFENFTKLYETIIEELPPELYDVYLNVEKSLTSVR